MTTALTYAQAAATALAQAMDRDPRIVALGEDIGRGGVFGQYTLDGAPLAKRFGTARIIDTPISESNIMGAAVGWRWRPASGRRDARRGLCAVRVDELVNQAAKNRFMFGGQSRVRSSHGCRSDCGARRQRSIRKASKPGLRTCRPSGRLSATPQDNFSLLASALQSDDPIVYLEHKDCGACVARLTPRLACRWGLPASPVPAPT